MPFNVSPLVALQKHMITFSVLVSMDSRVLTPLQLMTFNICLCILRVFVVDPL